ncbi:proteophosphoglycan ppg4 [Rhodotorula toruloides]|uniref:Proteophosphoglycan ppg4 n=1 Tax=Rhodotorula toruloides TaxID=5286 RepID=A0A511KN70_RHOTO|nr:proteophosphoglycan ppg4 [Rhodotorula toruloides]
MIRRMLDNLYTDPWSYSREQSKVLKDRSTKSSEEMWTQTSWQMTARFDMPPTGEGVKLVRRCALSDATLALQSAHIVAARRDKMDDGGMLPQGQIEMNWLISAQVIPAFQTPLHNDLDAHLLHLVPDRQLCLARLLCELKYQEERLAILEAAEAVPTGEKRKRVEVPPARPSFDTFYSALEARGASYRVTGSFRRPEGFLRRPDDSGLDILTYRVEGIDIDDPLRGQIAYRIDAPVSKPVFPHVITPISTNLLIWAMVDRVQQGYPDELSDETAELQQLLRCLIRFWRLTDDVDSASLRKLVERARTLLQHEQDSPWAKTLQDLASVSFADIAGNIKLPDTAVKSQTLPSAAQREQIRNAMEREVDDEDDLPQLNFPREIISSTSALPLTSSALEGLASQPLPLSVFSDPSGIKAGAPPGEFLHDNADGSVNLEVVGTGYTINCTSLPSLTHSSSAHRSASVAASLPPAFLAPLKRRGFPPGKAMHLSSWLENGPYTEPHIDEFQTKIASP